MKEGERLGRWEGEIKPGQRAEDRGQRTDDRRQRAEDRSQKTEVNEFGSRNAACDELSRIEAGKRRSA